MKHRLSLVVWLALLLLSGNANADAIDAPPGTRQSQPGVDETHGLTKLAQAQPAQASADAQPANDEPIGNVATLTGSATVTRNNEATPLKAKDDIFLNDVVQTAANSTLGITFNDATTFNLTANAQFTIDNYVYENGGKQNSALFNIVKGTIAFAAAEVAHTGDMKISTPTATLGIRGTTGLVEVPEGAAASNPNNVAIKLYPDADGRVGRIEVNDRNGARLGFLTQGSSGFTIRRGAGGRFTAAPLTISPQQALRDQGIVRQVHAAQNVGRRIVTQQRALRRANPNRNNLRNNPARQPGQQRQPSQLRQPGQRQNGLPQNPGAQQQPGQNGGQLQPPPGAPRNATAPAGPAVRQPGPLQPGVQRGGFQRPGFGNRLAPQRRAPPKGKQEKERR
jgi:hypothetical protein